jgi:hypothetical protein
MGLTSGSPFPLCRAVGGEVQVNGPVSANAWLEVYAEWVTSGSFVLNDACAQTSCFCFSLEAQF